MGVGMTDQDKILQFLRFSGPTLPGKVAKNLQTDTLLASAHLADLVSQRKVRVSKWAGRRSTTCRGRKRSWQLLLRGM